MLLSTSSERLETCKLVSKYDLFQKYIGKEVMRIISTSGISYSGIKEGDEKDFDAIVDFFVPSSVRSHPTGLDLGKYIRWPYTLQVDLSHEWSVSHRLHITKNSPN